MKKSFLSLGLLLAVTSVSLSGFAADTTMTGLDKYVHRYGITPMDITMDDLCPQDGRIYKTLSADQLSEVQHQLKVSLDSMSAVKARFGEIDKEDSVRSSGKIERWYSKNNACLNTDKFLNAVQAKMSEIQKTYFGKGASELALNVVSLGSRKASGERHMRYYAALGEKVARTELAIVENINLNKDQPELFERFLLTADTGDCAGKKIIVSGLPEIALDQGYFNLVRSLFAKQSARITYGGSGDITRPAAYATFIDWSQPGDKACAMKLRKALVTELGIEGDAEVFPVFQAIGINREGVDKFALSGGTISVNFGREIERITSSK